MAVQAPEGRASGCPKAWPRANLLSTLLPPVRMGRPPTVPARFLMHRLHALIRPGIREVFLRQPPLQGGSMQIEGASPKAGSRSILRLRRSLEGQIRRSQCTVIQPVRLITSGLAPLGAPPDHQLKRPGL